MPVSESREERSARAFAPSHITGFFQIFPNGSTGAGVNTEHGAITSARFTPGLQSSISVRLNGKDSEAPVSRRVIEKFFPELNGALSIEHEIQYPIGYGMGMSGAGAFSLSLALNDILGSPRSNAECMELAVSAEIESGTGLGDVVAQQFEGVMIGLPPYPSRSVEIIPHTGERVICAFFEPLETGKIIRDVGWKKKINESGEACMRDLMKDRSLSNLMQLCRRFTFETGLASPRVLEVLDAVPEASMAMLGQTAFAITSDVAAIESKFRRFTDRVMVSAIADHGAKVL